MPLLHALTCVHIVQAPAYYLPCKSARVSPMASGHEMCKCLHHLFESTAFGSRDTAEMINGIGGKSRIFCLALTSCDKLTVCVLIRVSNLLCWPRMPFCPAT